MLSAVSSHKMGSTSGKYNVEHGGSTPSRNTPLPSFSSNPNKSKKEKMSLPKFIHQNSLLVNKTNLTLIWLDTEIHNHPSNIDIQIKLRNLINYLRIFDEINAFERYIEQIGQMNKEKLFIIISTTLALTMIPYLHDLSQIRYIYIYGNGKIDIEVNQKLLKQYPKVKGIFSKCQCLLVQINEDKKGE